MKKHLVVNGLQPVRARESSPPRGSKGRRMYATERASIFRHFSATLSRREEWHAPESSLTPDTPTQEGRDLLADLFFFLFLYPARDLSPITVQRRGVQQMSVLAERGDGGRSCASAGNPRKVAIARRG